MTLSKTATFISLIALCSAQLFESVYLPLGWAETSRPVDAQHLLQLEIGLNQPRQDELETLLHQISEPDHANYGQHLSLEELEQYTRPSNASTATVVDWLESHGGVRDYSFTPSESFVSVSLPVHVAEELLSTRFRWYKHESGEELLRTLETSLPEHVHPHIAVIAPTTYFGRFHEHIKQVKQVKTMKLVHAAQAARHASACPKGGCSKQVQATCHPTGITPACLRSLYNINYTPKAPTKQTFGVTGYLEQWFNLRDLDLFEKFFSPQTSNSKTTVVLVNKGKNKQDPYEAGIEAGLDMQYATSLAYPIHTVFYSTGGRPPYKKDINTPDNDSEPYLNFLNYMLAQKKLPSVITTSYGEDEQTVPLSYAKKVCSLYAQLGARGVSVIHASGDGGATGAREDGYCLTNDGKRRTRFLPTFPASCAFVTSVGATQVSPTKGFASLEVAPYSGGGFSEYFGAPNWQKSLISSYLSKTGAKKSLAGLFNPNGRGFPDVALVGTHYNIVQSGYRENVYGTSCSAPAFAAMVVLLNDKRLANNKPVLGFMNPWLYRKALPGFTPVQSGSNSGCGYGICKPTNCKVKGKPITGFFAKGTWSPGAGLGSPNLAKLLELV